MKVQEVVEAVKFAYNIPDVRIIPSGPVFKVCSRQGMFLLKRMRCTAERIMMIDQWIRKLAENGFPRLVPFRSTREGLPYLICDNRIYIVSAWHPGEHPSFTFRNHLKKAANFWGRLHQTTQAIPEATHVKAFEYPALMEKTAFLESIHHNQISSQTSNRIDRAIAKWSGHFLKQAQISLENLSSLRYNDWEVETAASGICHHDPAPRNLIMQNNDWWLIDFELSGPGIFIVELVTLILRALRLHKWNPETFSLVLDAYAVSRSEIESETKFLPGLLCFPRSFWRLCSQRFEERLSWSEKHFQSRLWEITTEEPLRIGFLKEWFPHLETDYSYDVK